MRNALTREQVRGAVARSGDGSIPVMMAKWWGEGLEEAMGEELHRSTAHYPEDVCMLWYREPGYDTSPLANPEYRFGYLGDYSAASRHSIGEVVELLPDWGDLDRFLAHFPSAYEPGNFDTVTELAAKSGERYKIGCFWRLFHERLWAIRGMENLMMDYYDEMDGLMAICKRLVGFYKDVVDRYHALGCDAIFTSDDLGHQRGPMMSPDIFHELYFPFYKEIIGYTHSKGMQFMLHSCGDNTLLMDDLVAAGLDVFHPVQKGCMDMEATAEKYGDRISFLAGLDVQHLIVEGTADEVRQEVRRIKRVFHRPRGGLLLAMGNGIMPGTPLANIHAALDEMYSI